MNGGRPPKEAKAGTPGGEKDLPSPWRAPLAGMLAGAVFSIVLSLVLILAVEAGERRILLLCAAVPIPGAGVSACAAALAKGASPGRALAVALLALLGAGSLAGPLEYGLLVSMVTPPLDPSSPGFQGALSVSGLAAFTALAIAAGTVLGLMLGRGPANRR